MYAITFFWFLFGVIIGYLSYNFSTEASTEYATQHNRIKSMFSLEKIKKIEPVDNTTEKIKKIKILCFLLTMPKSHSLRAVHIQQLWGKHCDKLLFSSTLTDINLEAIGFNVSNDYDHLWGKTKLMLQYIHKNYLNDYDWFIKGDDDTFLITENLRYMLSAYSTDDPIYFGYKFNTSLHKRGYFSGGAGYVMSRKTVRIFVEKVLTNKDFSDPKKGLNCRTDTDARDEDWHITLCLDHYNVYAGDGRDILKHERFLMWTPEKVLTAGVKLNDWYWQRKYYWTDEGLDCCSNYTISFHYITAKLQYTLYYLTYRLNAFGIKHRFSPPPVKKDFREAQIILDQERFNLTLRGY